MIHSTSPNRYSPCSWALRAAAVFFASRLIEKTPAPVPILGGSAGDPSVTKEPKGICAAAGGAVEMPNAKSKIAPSQPMDLVLTAFPPPPAETALSYPKTQTTLRKRNGNSDLLHSFRRQDQLLTNSRFHGRMASVRDDYIARFGPGAH